LHAETALGTGRMTSTFECSKKWGDYRTTPSPLRPLWQGSGIKKPEPLGSGFFSFQPRLANQQIKPGF
ncbi:hypothetical protein, partial [Aeromonas veronii]|uniref:hypothetical protein n=1 Tax=Aeromonas veronii TaxID=654 RepID=UPI003003D6CA